MIYNEFIADTCKSRNGSSITRHAVRGVIFQDHQYLMLYSEVNKDYSFPGGGIETGESDHAALKRELMEECGAKILSIASPIAEIIEIDPAYDPDIDLFIRHTWYYPCRISEAFAAPDLTPDEILSKCHPIWVELETALYNNQMLLKNPDSFPPRWVRRETYILNKLVQHPKHFKGIYLD